MIFEIVGGVGLAIGEADGDGEGPGEAVTVGVGVCACADAAAKTARVVRVSSADALRERMERVIVGNCELSGDAASAGEFSS